MVILQPENSIKGNAASIRKSLVWPKAKRSWAKMRRSYSVRDMADEASPKRS